MIRFFFIFMFLMAGCSHFSPRSKPSSGHKDITFFDANNIISMNFKSNKIIPRRSPATQGATFFLPMILESNKALVVSWDGKGSFGDFLLKEGLALSPSGDSLIALNENSTIANKLLNK